MAFPDNSDPQNNNRIGSGFYRRSSLTVACFFLLLVPPARGLHFTSIARVSNETTVVIQRDLQTTNIDLFACTRMELWDWTHAVSTNLAGSSNTLVFWVLPSSPVDDVLFFTSANGDVDSDGDDVTDGTEIYLLQTDPETSNQFSRLTHLSFSGDDNYVVKSDLQTTNYTAPQYIDADANGDTTDPGDQATPICYTRDGMLEVSATFDVDPMPTSIVFTVFGDGPGPVDIPPTIADRVGDTLTLPLTAATNPLPNQVDLVDPFCINWSISYDGGSNWFDAGSSSNRLYQTWSAPSQTNPIETLLQIGCQSSTGTTGVVGTDDDQILSNVWTKLQTKWITRASDGFPLTYYGFHDVNSNSTWDAGIDIDRNSATNCSATTAEQLILDANGQCHSWLTLMNETMKAQGLGVINGVTNMRVMVIPTGNPAFAIKNWEKGGAYAYYVITNDYAGVDGSDAIPPGLGEASDAVGTSAQGNSPNSPSGFQNHWMVRMNGSYFDPSYANGPFTDLRKYEEASFAGEIAEFAGTSYLLDLLPDDGNPTNHSDEINDYIEVPFD